MATIGTANSSQIKNTPRRIYLAMENFQADFFEYTVTKSIQGQRVVTTGTLTAVTADTSKTPQGRTLRETGKKLYPNAHPGITTYMVGVYDDQTGLNGYINPNSPVFTVLNSDKPTYLPDGRDPGSYGGVNQGQGIYTRGNAYVGGDISGDGNLVLAGNATIAGSERLVGNLSVGGSVDASGIIVSNAVYTVTAGGTITINAALYNQAIVTINADATITFSNVAKGRSCDLVVINGSGGGRALSFNITSIYAGGSFNIASPNFADTSRRSYRFVGLTSTQMYLIGGVGSY